MSKLLTILGAVALVVVFAVSAHAKVENVKVGGEIRFRADKWDNFDLNDDTSTLDRDFYRGRARLNASAELTDNVSTYIRLVQDQEWGDYDGTNERILLEQAYVTFKEFFYKPLTLQIGRQWFYYDNALVLAMNEDPLNDPGYRIWTFDGIKATLELEPWSIDLFTVKEIESKNGDDKDLYGIYATWKATEDWKFKPYVIYEHDSSSSDNSPIYLGILTNCSAIDNLDLHAEVVKVEGDYGTYDRDALAVDVGATYTFADITYKPSITVQYVFGSGDDPGTNDNEAYELIGLSDHGTWYIACGDYQNFQNLHMIRVGAGAKFTDKLSFDLDLHKFIMDENEHISMDNVNINTANGLKGTDDDFGLEAVLAIKYAYTEDVTFKLVGAYFAPGDAFDDANDDEAIFLRAEVKVCF